MPKENFTCSHGLRVRWAEVDPQGIVFNGNYLTYFDVGVTEWYRAIGCAYPSGFVEHGMDLFAKRAEIEFHAPARYDDWLDVSIRAARLGRTSLTIHVSIDRNEEPIVSGVLVCVNVDVATRRPAPLPAFLRDAILAYERTPPEEG